MIAADETGRPQFYDLLRGRRTPAYIAFDIVWLNGAFGALIKVAKKDQETSLRPKVKRAGG